jgi:hypothetical protein
MTYEATELQGIRSVILHLPALEVFNQGILNLSIPAFAGMTKKKE